MRLARWLSTLSLPALVWVTAAWSQELYLLPAPKELAVGAPPVAAPAPVRILTGANLSLVQQYALDQLLSDLKQWFGVDAQRITASAETSDGSGTLLVLGAVDAPHVQQWLGTLGAKAAATGLQQEGFACVTKRATAVVAGKDDNGVLYGTFCLLQLLRKTDGVLVLPQVTIRDYPSVRDRALTNMACYYGQAAATERSTSWFDTYARARLNLMPSTFYSMGYLDKKGVVDEAGYKVAQEFVGDCRKRGMKAFGVFYFLGLCRALEGYACPSNPAHVQLVQTAIERYCEAGMDGFIVNFDDIRNEHVDAWESCTSCQAKGWSLGSMHAEWIRLVKQVCDRFGGKQLVSCPYPYIENQQWRDGYCKYNGEQYLKEFFGTLSDPFFAGVEFFHCAFRAEELKALAQVGFRDYRWWFNHYGLHLWDIGRRNYKSLFVQNYIFSGFVNALVGWPANGGNVISYDDESQSWQFNDETLGELRTLHERTQGVYGCLVGEYRAKIGFAAYAWDPARYNWRDIERAMVARTFGPGSVPLYTSWKTQIRSLCRDFNTLTAYTEGREERQAEYRQRYLQLRESLQRLLGYHKAFLEAPGFALIDRRCIRNLVSRMEQNDKVLSDLFTRQNVVKAHVGAVSDDHSAHGISRPKRRTLRLESGLTSYLLEWSARIMPNGDVYCTNVPSAGIGMTRPSEPNWFSGGFFNVEVNGMSLGNAVPEFEVVQLTEDRQGIRGHWKLDYAEVEIVFSLLEDDALMLDGTIRPTGTNPHTLRIELRCIPSAGQHNWSPDSQDKWLLTAVRNHQHGAIPYLDVEKEHWFLFYDQINDYPFVNKGQPGMNQDAKGPCAFLLEPENVRWAHINLTNYFIPTFIQYKKGTQRFRLAFYDMYRSTNEQAKAYFSERGEPLFDAFRYQDAGGQTE